MEQDRYQENHKLFIIGIISLILSLSLFVFSLYILPNLLFGSHYDIPEFIGTWRVWLQHQYAFSESAASKFIFWFFIILTLIFGFIAYFSSNRIDDQIYSAELQKEPKPVTESEGLKDSLGLFLKILFIVALVFVAAALFEWIIYIPPPS